MSYDLQTSHIVRQVIDILRKEMMPPRATSCPLFIYISRIAVNGKDHIARTVSGDLSVVTAGSYVAA